MVLVESLQSDNRSKQYSEFENVTRTSTLHCHAILGPMHPQRIIDTIHGPVNAHRVAAVAQEGAAPEGGFVRGPFERLHALINRVHGTRG